MTPIITRTLEERFWPKVNKAGPNGCWEWTAGCFTASNGKYGSFRVGAKSLRAHRVAFEILVGPIPEGMQLDHLCRNTRCVNPAHLEPVTHRENQLRGTGFVAENASKTHCVNGHALTGDNVYRHGKNSRGCRLCRTEAQRRYRSRQVAA